LIFKALNFNTHVKQRTIYETFRNGFPQLKQSSREFYSLFSSSKEISSACATCFFPKAFETFRQGHFANSILPALPIQDERFWTTPKQPEQKSWVTINFRTPE